MLLLLWVVTPGQLAAWVRRALGRGTVVLGLLVVPALPSAPKMNKSAGRIHAPLVSYSVLFPQLSESRRTFVEGSEEGEQCQGGIVWLWWGEVSALLGPKLLCSQKEILKED